MEILLPELAVLLFFFLRNLSDFLDLPIPQVKSISFYKPLESSQFKLLLPVRYYDFVVGKAKGNRIFEHSLLSVDNIYSSPESHEIITTLFPIQRNIPNIAWLERTRA